MAGGLTRTAWLAVVLAVLPATASAAETYASEPRELLFSDVHEAFSIFTFDTGYLPSINDPISVRFHITPQGGVVTEMEGVSQLEWGVLPDGSMEHTIEAVPGSGWFGVDATIDIEAEVHLDIFGLYTGSIPLWTEQILLDKGQAFDTLLLPGSGEGPLEVSISDPSLVDPLEFELTVFTGLDVLLAVEVYPELVAAIAGDHIASDVVYDELEQTSEGQWVPFAPPVSQPAELALTSTYVADLTSVLSLVIEPSVSLDTFLGSFQLVAFPIPVDLVDTSELKSFEPEFLAHPLPAVAPPPETVDFGDVEVGALSNWPLAWENLGKLGLEGFARIEGPDSFTVWPEYLYADEHTDGAVITFEPKLEGPQEAWLVVETSDPAVPEVRVLLTGNGWVEPVEPTDRPPAAEETEFEGEVTTCGCRTAGTPGGWAWLALMPLLYVHRRRTSFTRR